MERVRVGLIGTGNIAQVAHLPILSKNPEVDLVAICDLDVGKVKSIASKYHIKNFTTNYLELIERKDIDAVFITTSTDTHLPIGQAALESGKNVFIEKPIARKYSEAVTLSEAVKKSGAFLMVCMNHRFRQDIATLKNFISNGELGTIFLVRAGWLNYQSSTRQWIKKSEKSGGGVFVDLGIVMVDLVLWLLGFPRVRTVSASMYRHKTRDVEDSVSSYIRLHNDVSVNIDVSWNATVEENKFYCDVIGTKGSAKINPLEIHKLMAGSPVNVTPLIAESYTSSYLRSYEQEIKHFIGVVQRRYALISDASEAVHRMKLVEAVYESAAKRKEINFRS